MLQLPYPLNLSRDVVFSMGGDSKNNLLSKTALQVTLTTTDQRTQTFIYPYNSSAKTASYYSNLGFLSNVTAGIQSQLNNCITSIPTNFTTLTLNNVSVATTNQLPSMTGVLRQGTTLSPV